MVSQPLALACTNLTTLSSNRQTCSNWKRITLQYMTLRFRERSEFAYAYHSVSQQKIPSTVWWDSQRCDCVGVACHGEDHCIPSKIPGLHYVLYTACVYLQDVGCETLLSLFLDTGKWELSSDTANFHIYVISYHHNHFSTRRFSTLQPTIVTPDLYRETLFSFKSRQASLVTYGAFYSWSFGYLWKG